MAQTLLSCIQFISYQGKQILLVDFSRYPASEVDNVLAHDLNNGLGVIAAYCELMVEDAEPESECVKRLRLVLEVVHRLAARINEHERRIRFSEAHATGQTRSSSENRENRRCG